MATYLTEEQIDDLIENVIGTESNKHWKKGNKMICCPVHGESHASMGVSVDKQVCHCFACGFKGGFANLLVYSLPDQFKYNPENPKSFYPALMRGYQFLNDRYELEYKELSPDKVARGVKRYEDLRDYYFKEDEEKILPMYKLAPFKSGKATYEYFFDRGFTKKSLSLYKIGYDDINETVTIPVFKESGELVGIIGRYIDPNRRKNERYKIYDNFKRSDYLYPLNISKPKDGEIILVEGQFDAIRLHEYNITNAYATMTNTISSKQLDWILRNADSVICIGDNDSRGQEFVEKAREQLQSHILFKTIRYPKYGKDVCDWDKETIKKLLRNTKEEKLKIRRML